MKIEYLRQFSDLGEWAMALPGSVQIPFLMYIIHQVIFCNVLENIFHLAVDISYS